MFFSTRKSIQSLGLVFFLFEASRRVVHNRRERYFKVRKTIVNLKFSYERLRTLSSSSGYKQYKKLKERDRK